MAVRDVDEPMRSSSRDMAGEKEGGVMGGREGCDGSCDGSGEDGTCSSVSMRAWAAERCAGVGSGSM